MVCNYDVMVRTKDTSSFLNDLYQIPNAFVVYNSMVSIDTDRITINLDDSDLTFLALRHRVNLSKVDDTLLKLSTFKAIT